MTSLIRYAKISRSSVAFAAFSLCVFVYANRLISKDLSFVEDLAIVNFVTDCFRNYDHYQRLVKIKCSPQIPSSAHLSAQPTNEVVGVVVLGEAAARSHMSVYGYSRKTTPGLDSLRDELVVFNDLVTPEGVTALAMRLMFTTATIENRKDIRYSMSQVLDSVGVRVSLYSNQERWGRFAGDESFVFDRCRPMLFMNEMYEDPRYDDVLVDNIKSDMAKCRDNRIYFLHLRGSHSPACLGYPNECAPFAANERTKPLESANTQLSVNHYDNSIWFTDKVLGDIIQRLAELRCPAYMIYISDHGETPSSSSWRDHGDRNLWEVPFVVWTSKEFRSCFPERVARMDKAKDKPLQSDQLLYGLLRFAGVAGLDVDPELDFLSDQFVPRSPRVIDGGKRPYEQAQRLGRSQASSSEIHL